MVGISLLLFINRVEMDEKAKKFKINFNDGKSSFIDENTLKYIINLQNAQKNLDNLFKENNYKRFFPQQTQLDSWYIRN